MIFGLVARGGGTIRHSFVGAVTLCRVTFYWANMIVCMFVGEQHPSLFYRRVGLCSVLANLPSRISCLDSQNTDTVGHIDSRAQVWTGHAVQVL